MRERMVSTDRLADAVVNLANNDKNASAIVTAAVIVVLIDTHGTDAANEFFAHVRGRIFPDAPPRKGIL